MKKSNVAEKIQAREAMRRAIRYAETGTAERFDIGLFPELDTIKGMSEESLFLSLRAPEFFYGEDRIMLGNGKLALRVGIFSLLAYTTCGRLCYKCYAEKAQKAYPTAYDSRLVNTWLAVNRPYALRNLLARQLFSLLKKGKLDAVRVHESGDFFNASYAGLWHDIATEFRSYGVPFYAYTKQAYADRLIIPGTFYVVSSFLPDGSLNYGKEKEIAEKCRAQGIYLCPCRSGDKEKICHVRCSHCSGGLGLDGKMHSDGSGLIYTGFVEH